VWLKSPHTPSNLSREDLRRYANQRRQSDTNG